MAPSVARSDDPARRGTLTPSVNRAKSPLTLFDACAVVSERERDAVLALAPRADVRVVPNGIDPDENRLASGGADQRKKDSREARSRSLIR